MLDTGGVGSLGGLAERYAVDRSYAGRILRLATLAPDTIEAILDGREPEGVTLERLKKPFPAVWEEQGEALGFAR